MEDPQIWSLVPAAVAITLAFITKRVIPSLFAGVIAGSIVLFAQTGVGADANPITRFIIPSIGTEKYAEILFIYLWCLGGLLGMWEKTGAALHFARTIGGAFVRGPRAALLYAWVLGVVFHQGGTISTILAGTTAKPVADAHNVSHEELAYVVDSTASPIATVLPFNAWPAFTIGLMAGTFPLIAEGETGIGFFVASIPFNFYGMLAVATTFAFSMGWLPWIGKSMRAAQVRARTTGALDAPDANPMLPGENPPQSTRGEAAVPHGSVSVGDSADTTADTTALDPSIDPSDRVDSTYTPSLIDFIVPIAVLLLVSVVPYIISRNSYVKEAFFASVLSSMLIARIRGMSLANIMDGFIDGCRNMTIGAIILALAVTLGTVANELQTAAYITGLFSSGLSPLVLPALLTVICMVIAFSTGTSWGTFAVVLPVAMPLAYALEPSLAYSHVIFGAVLGGAVYGDQCSPVSDTSIMSSMFCGCDLMHHVKTQLPLATGVAIVSAVASTIAAALVI